jgi:hypothetical protein
MEITKNQQEEEIHFYFPLSTTVESRFSDSLKAVFSQLLGYQYSELTVVGKTVESYRMALESEISRWSEFAKVFRKSHRLGLLECFAVFSS